MVFCRLRRQLRKSPVDDSSGARVHGVPACCRSRRLADDGGTAHHRAGGRRSRLRELSSISGISAPYGTPPCRRAICSMPSARSGSTSPNRTGATRWSCGCLLLNLSSGCGCMPSTSGNNSASSCRPFAAIGAVQLIRSSPRRAVLVLTAYGVGVVFALGYNVGDAHVFFLQSHLMLALLVAPGLVLVERAMAVRGAIAVLALILARRQDLPRLPGARPQQRPPSDGGARDADVGPGRAARRPARGSRLAIGKRSELLREEDTTGPPLQPHGGRDAVRAGIDPRQHRGRTPHCCRRSRTFAPGSGVRVAVVSPRGTRAWRSRA